MHEETYGIQTVYLQLWDRFIDSYIRGRDIPPTYARELYPWLGDIDILTAKFVTIFDADLYDDALQKLLAMVDTYAQPLTANMWQTTQPLQRLPLMKTLWREGNESHLRGYMKLDSFISSLNLIMSNWRVANSRPNHVEFLADVRHEILFGHIGEFMRLREGGAPLAELIAARR